MRRPEDLKHHDCLAFAYPSTDDWRNADKLWRLHGPEGEVEVAVSGPMTINSSQALHRAACQGMGIVMLPDALVSPDLQAGRLWWRCSRITAPLSAPCICFTRKTATGCPSCGSSWTS
ncbi:MAG: hypothetical protein GAK32_01613 [Pseudomonas fluorescens]|nr:MAG: hypothetical protein GAK32_01613 [Pseudomonas fluorescens]